MMKSSGSAGRGGREREREMLREEEREEERRDEYEGSSDDEE
jgi:hypothetical protein